DDRRPGVLSVRGQGARRGVRQSARRDPGAVHHWIRLDEREDRRRVAESRDQDRAEGRAQPPPPLAARVLCALQEELTFIESARRMDNRKRITPEATIGPFYPGIFVMHMPQDLWTVSPLVAHHPEGQPIVLAARFVDALKRPVPSLVVEFWQANAHGKYRHPAERSPAPIDP